MQICRRQFWQLARSIGTFKTSSAKASDIQHQHEKPTVVCLGWAYSVDKQVVKFTDLHNSLGYDTLHYILPDSKLFEFDHKKQSEDVSALIQELKSRHVSKIVINTFSNNGYTVYQHFTKQLSEPKNSDLKICGAIFDSGPTAFNVSHLLGGGSMTYPWVSKEFLSFTYNFLQVTDFDQNIFSTLPSYFKMRKIIHCNWKKYPEFHDSFYNHAIECRRTYPLLYLYSTKDFLAKCGPIESIIAHQKKINPKRTVLSYNFNDTPHVGHYKTYPEQYASQLSEFYRCL